MVGKVLTVAECEAALIEARAAYDEAHRRSQSASSDEISAKNRLNDVQKQFDDAVAALKQDSPWDTRWHREKKGVLA